MSRIFGGAGERASFHDGEAEDAVGTLRKVEMTGAFMAKPAACEELLALTNLEVLCPVPALRHVDRLS